VSSSKSTKKSRRTKASQRATPLRKAKRKKRKRKVMAMERRTRKGSRTGSLKRLLKKETGAMSSKSNSKKGCGCTLAACLPRNGGLR